MHDDFTSLKTNLDFGGWLGVDNGHVVNDLAVKGDTWAFSNDYVTVGPNTLFVDTCDWTKLTTNTNPYADSAIEMTIENAFSDKIELNVPCPRPEEAKYKLKHR